ncbi:MAG: hypothetical protein QXR48_00505 [Candidatus Woesearchaeota archaeon]
MPRVKGQMEIMGLAIIIILVMLGLLFTVTWLLKSPATKPVQKAKESVLAANFLSTMLGTTTECNKRTVAELLRDCALTQGATKCGALTSCEYVHNVIEDILNSTMNVWRKDYYFHMTGSSSVESIKFGRECKGEKEGKIAPLPVSPRFEIKLYLDICG